jgi:hypothetical protein
MRVQTMRKIDYGGSARAQARRWALYILAMHKAKDVESCPVPAPYFRYAELGKYREFWQRWMAQVYLKDQVRWRIFCQIQISFSRGQGHQLDVKTPVRLKPRCKSSR